MSHLDNFYDIAYGNFEASVLAEIRREIYDRDIGQNSWSTASEYQQFYRWLDLAPTSNVLDIASGPGGSALFMARLTGCHVTGLDINQSAVHVANEMAQIQGLDSFVRFQKGDASKPLPFEGQLFNTVVCIDAIIHMPDRLRVLKEWYRVLGTGGRILYTDTTVVTGLVSHEEIATRSSIGYFLFSPPGENERLIQEAGFELMLRQDITENMAGISKRRYEARARHRSDLIKIEGEAMFEGTQRFLSEVHILSSERRLSRFVFLAGK